jgi:hypothetical protein
MSLTIKRPSTKGLHFNWNEPSVLALRATPQLPRYPDPSSGPACLMRPRDNLLEYNRTHSCACLLDKTCAQRPRAILLEVTSRMQCRPPLALREARLGRRLCSRRETVKLALHPCQQAAAFLACTMPPDFVASRRSFTVFAPAPSSSSTCAATSCLR